MKYIKCPIGIDLFTDPTPTAESMIAKYNKAPNTKITQDCIINDIDAIYEIQENTGDSNFGIEALRILFSLQNNTY